MHLTLGIGAILAERLTDSGAAVHAWFVDSGTTKTVLAESLTEATEPDLTKEQSRALRHAVAEYKKSHRRRARQTADRPRRRRPDTKLEWRRTFEFAGREDELVPVDEEVSAAG